MAMLGLLKNITKVAIAGGAIYVTLEEDVWSTTSRGSKAVDRLRTSVLPATSEYMKHVPSNTDVCIQLRSTWNYGIQKAFGYLLEVPDLSVKYTKVGVCKLQNLMRS